MQYYGILGTGDAKRKVIEDSLLDYNDRSEKLMALVPWLGRPPAGLERAYDWLIDNEMTFEIYFAEGGKPPAKDLEKVASDVIEVRNPVRSILKRLADEGGDLLVLFDGDDQQLTDTVMDAFDLKIPVLELNNGLTPLTLVDEPDEEPAAPAEEPEERPEKEDTARPVTEEEILNMTVAELRTALKALGVDTTGLRKADLQEALINHDRASTADEPVTREDEASTGGRVPPAADDGHSPTATVVIVMPEGSTIVRQLDVRHLAGLLP